MSSFGDRLRQVREAKGWSQEKVGFECEVTKATVSKWELGRGEPGLAHLSRLRQVFADDNMTLDWLIDDAVSAANLVASHLHITEGASPAYSATPRLAQDATELAMLVRFRGLSKRRQRALVDFLDSESAVSN